jgi:hypothetical protein
MTKMMEIKPPLPSKNISPRNSKSMFNKCTIYFRRDHVDFGRRAREILLYALLSKLFNYSIHLVISPKLLAFKAVIA